MTKTITITKIINMIIDIAFMENNNDKNNHNNKNNDKNKNENNNRHPWSPQKKQESAKNQQ